MSLQRRSLLSGLLAIFVLAPSVFAVCVFPLYIQAEVGTSLSTVRGVVDAPGAADVKNFQGELCDFPTVTATVTITRNGASAYTLTRNGPGSVLLTATGPAAIGNCYASSILASAPPALNDSGTGAEQCWVGPPPEGGTGCTSDCSFENDGPGANCPLILDLNGDGIQTTDASRPVYFDLDADGYAKHITWTNPRTREAFLWIDLIPNHRVDDGSELFGIGTLLPSGERAPDGFAALAAYDDLGMGGDGDGKITVNDQVWGHLRLWVDANHDGVSQATEVAPIHRHGVVEIPLQYVVDRLPDPSGNYHFLRGEYLRRVPSGHPETHALDDVFFRYVP